MISRAQSMLIAKERRNLAKRQGKVLRKEVIKKTTKPA